MFRVQVWCEERKSYVDAHLTFDEIGVTGFQPATVGNEATNFLNPSDALSACNDLNSAIGAVCRVLDMNTGKKHFDELDLES